MWTIAAIYSGGVVLALTYGVRLGMLGIIRDDYRMGLITTSYVLVLALSWPFWVMRSLWELWVGKEKDSSPGGL